MQAYITKTDSHPMIVGARNLSVGQQPRFRSKVNRVRWCCSQTRAQTVIRLAGIYFYRAASARFRFRRAQRREDFPGCEISKEEADQKGRRILRLFSLMLRRL